ncbi:MAG: hypothetical protein QM781_07385 [Chitinophagaceae bacterium]
MKISSISCSTARIYLSGMNPSVAERTPTILFFEDEPESISSLKTIIQSSLAPAVQINTVSSIAKALTVMREENPSLIIANLELSGAFDLLEAVRHSPVPVLLTIHEYPESLAAVRFLQWEYLIKPFHSTLVSRKVQEVWLKPADQMEIRFDMN